MLNSAKPLKIYITGSSDPFYLQEAMLGSVSPELAAAVIEATLLISKGAFQIFVIWLLHHELGVGQGVSSWFDPEKAQKSLAEAWNFGAHYKIPAF